MFFTSLFFDLDGTVYSNDNGLWDEIRHRMSRYMIERMLIPSDQVPLLRQAYYEKYGTTLRGLQHHHQVDVDDYLSYVHDIPLTNYLKPLPELRKILLSLPQHLWIFTNASSEHARRVLEVMGLRECFSGIIDIRSTSFFCKPDPEAYRRALAFAKETNANRCILFDDSISNLESAHSLGIRTALIGASHACNSAADWLLNSLIDLPNVVPELWEV
jgi:putative hydrolase of the HAD superfamily